MVSLASAVVDTRELQRRLARFADERDWEQFHTPKNLAMALASEAGELLAEFRWVTPEASMALDDEPLERVRHEVADVAMFLLRLCDKLDIDLGQAIEEKLGINAQNYPVELAKGTAEKHSRLGRTA